MITHCDHAPFLWKGNFLPVWLAQSNNKEENILEQKTYPCDAFGRSYATASECIRCLA